MNDAHDAEEEDSLRTMERQRLGSKLRTEERQELVKKNIGEGPPLLASIDELLETSNTSTLWGVFLCLGMANSADAAEILCLSYLLADPQFETDVLESVPASLLSAAVFCGMLVGGLYVGTVSDSSAGRKLTLLAGLALNGFAGLVSSVYTTATIRFLAGIGIGATVPPLFCLANELAPPSCRGFWVTVVASFWMVGSVFVAVTAWIMLGVYHWHWRIFTAACALPSVAGVILIAWFVPESPRFLLQQEGRYEDALRSMRRLVPMVEALQRPASVRVATPTSCIVYVRSILSLYTTPQRRLTTLVLQAIWFSLSFSSYGILTWINTLFKRVHLENLYTNEILFAAANFPGNLLAMYALDRFGRRLVLTCSLIASAASLLSFAAAADKQWVVITAACCFQCFTVCSWNAIDVMSTERFSMINKTTGLGICAASGRLGAGVAQICNASMGTTSMLVTAASTLLVGAVAPMFLTDVDQQSTPMVDCDVSEIGYQLPQYDG